MTNEELRTALATALVKTCPHSGTALCSLTQHAAQSSAVLRELGRVAAEYAKRRLA